MSYKRASMDYYDDPEWNQCVEPKMSRRDEPPPLETKRVVELKTDPTSVLENSWPLFVNKYVRTFSFCKWCHDRIYGYQEKMTYDKDLKCYMIKIPCCRKCALANIEINKLHHEHFGNKKKPE
jgi:hypothetical protein